MDPVNQGLLSASGFQGLENSPLARPGYYNKFISRGWEMDFLPAITNTEIDERITACNQVVQFTRQPDVGPWRTYEKNQELIPDTISPEAFCMRICNAKYKALKFDKLDIRRICDRWDDFEASFLDSIYQTLSAEWRAYVLAGMVLEADAMNKGATAGRRRNINLGAPNAPKQIRGATIATEVGLLKRILMERFRWVEGEMVLVIPSAVYTSFITSPYANALQMGSCVDCSLLVTGQIPGMIGGFHVYVTESLPTVIDENGREAFYVIAAHRQAYAFASEILEGELVRPSRYFGIEYQMLAVWGAKAILPDAIAVGYWQMADEPA